MRSLFQKAKFIVVVAVLVTVGSDWVIQAGQRKEPSITLSAAGADAAKGGIKTYKLRKPKANGNAITLDVDLLDANQTVIGHWTENRAIQGLNRVTEMRLNDRQIKMQVEGTDVGVTATFWIDYVEVYRGPFAPAEGAGAETLARHKDLFALVSAVTKDIETARGDAEKLSAEWSRVAFMPGVLRRPAMSVASWLPRTTTLYAKRSFEGGCSGSFDYCETAYGWNRSGACSDAKDEAGDKCSDWVNCIGCCAYQSESCDCTCVSGDFGCACYACGARCDPLVAED